MNATLVALSAAALAACGGGSGGGTMGDDGTTSDAAAPPSDAAAQHSGVSVAWLADPALPGIVKSDLTVTSARLRLDRLEVIGDNAQPMTETTVLLDWMSVGDPPSIGFATAPQGLYSQVNLHLDGDVVQYSYEIAGTTKVNGNIKNFVIHDRNALDVDVKGYATQLSPGGQATMTVRIDLSDALSSIHFDQLDEDNGALELDTTGQQMPMFRMKLKDAFKK